MDGEYRSLYTRERSIWGDIPSNQKVLDEIMDDVDEEEMLREEMNALKLTQRRIRAKR